MTKKFFTSKLFIFIVWIIAFGLCSLIPWPSAKDYSLLIVFLCVPEMLVKGALIISLPIALTIQHFLLKNPSPLSSAFMIVIDSVFLSILLLIICFLTNSFAWVFLGLLGGIPFYKYLKKEPWLLIVANIASLYFIYSLFIFLSSKPF